MLITSRDNNTIKEIIKLKDKKYRKDSFIIEGIKPIEEAIKENAIIEKIVKVEGATFDVKIDGIDIIEVPQKLFNEMTDVETPQGILAVVKKTNSNTIDYSADFILVLDNIQDPGNLGTIIRTADSAYLRQILVSKGTADPYSPKVIRSTMGSIFRVNIIESDNLEASIDELKNNGFQVVTTSLQTDNNAFELDYMKKAVIIGNEANGVEENIANKSDIKVKIPMLGKTESLNAAVSASIMVYEYVKQKISLQK